MMFYARACVLLLVALSLSACGARSELPRGSVAYDVIPSVQGEEVAEYTIGTGDKLRIAVFQEEELSQEETIVDAEGNLILPLLGTIQAEGLTATQLARLLEELYEARYLVDPQISVQLLESASQRVTVGGEVNSPGQFAVRGETSLLQAVAIAGGITETARRSEVVVFRTVEGVRYGAVFDLGAISRGDAADPRLLANDIVVVGNNPATTFLRDLIRLSPTLAALFLRI